MMDLKSKYASLLLNYCLSLKAGDKLYVVSTFLAEPLLLEIYKQASSMGVLVEFNLSFEGMNAAYINHATPSLLQMISPFQSMAIHEFDAYLVIRAPYNTPEAMINRENQKTRLAATSALNQIYFDRTASGSMKRCLCQYPTPQAAAHAGMTLEEYEKFVYHACKLYSDDAIAAWKQLGREQQYIVDYLNKVDKIMYQNKRSEIQFSVKDRIWINSDGKANMPSGEVYTSPIEESVNGFMHFDYPSMYENAEVSGITLHVANGIVTKWHAEVGQDVLDHVMEIEGSRMFGEVAIGTNYDITRPTKNILFDEKIGGTVHMALGQSYKQTGGKNQSSVHWDLIADMRDGGVITADGVKIYEDGKFII